MGLNQKDYFAQWYRENKKDLSRKRKQRYARDKNYREKAKAQARRYRREHPRPARPRQVKRFRELNGQDVQVFQIGEAAQKVGCGMSTIRSWEAKGVIPKPVFDDWKRLYTERQIRLMTMVRDYMSWWIGAYHTPKGEAAYERLQETIEKYWDVV